MSSGHNPESGSSPTTIVPVKELELFFQCPVCLDWTYKPVVQSCRHVFCFWCTLNSMNGVYESQCPLCRRVCSHFPKICQMLHFLLMKLIPEEYCRRAHETEEYETSEQMFSPHILLSAKPSKPPDNVSAEVSASTCGSLKFVQSPGATQVLSSGSERLDNTESPLASTERGQEEMKLQSVCVDQTCNDLSAVDFLCLKCKQFLYKPVVLHCGEVFCQGCVAKSGSIVSCPSCGEAHPGRSVDVCLDLQHYLECAFPEHVVKRKADAPQYLAECSMQETSNSQVLDEYQVVHPGVGCDGCGMHPILGERYNCEDCVERAGYDLCGNCYEKTTNWEGRFNQQHTSNHRMQKITIRPVPLRVLESYRRVIFASEDSSEHTSDDSEHERHPI